MHILVFISIVVFIEALHQDKGVGFVPQKEALLKLQFNQVVIDELWKAEDYYLCSYQQLEDSSIIFVSGNETYLKLRNISKDYIGKRIDTLPPNQDIQQISMLFRKYKTSNEYINYMREILYEGKCTYWDISVIIEFPYLRCVGKKINLLSMINKGGQAYDINSMKLEDCYSGSILVQMKSEGRYKICSCSETVSCAVPEIREGNDLQEMFEGYLYRMKTACILDECIRAGKPIRYFDILCREREEEKNADVLEKPTDLIYVVLLPVLHQNFKGIFILITVVENEENVKINEKSNNKKKLTQEELFGYCVIYNGLNKEHQYITEMNSYFARHLYEEKLNIDTIFASPLVEKARQNMIAVSGSIVFRQKDGTEKKYSINVVPAIHEEKIEKILITLIPEQEIEYANHMMFSLLTPREQEVISLVVNGYTNRCIAYELNITEGTVKKVIYNCYQKLGICSRIELIKLLMAK